MLDIRELKAAYQAAIGNATSNSTIYNLLARRGWRKLMPRPFHPNVISRLSMLLKTSFSARSGGRSARRRRPDPDRRPLPLRKGAAALAASASRAKAKFALCLLRHLITTAPNLPKVLNIRTRKDSRQCNLWERGARPLAQVEMGQSVHHR